MLKILILGCSFTQGHTKPYENSWSWQLSQRHPHIQFSDYSKGGSSVQWSRYCLDSVTDKFDEVIAQYTGQYRLSIWPKDINLNHYRIQKSPNYSTWDSDKLELECDFAGSGWLGTPRFGWPGNSEPKVPFIREYFTHLPEEFNIINYQCVVADIHRRVDFGFKWHNDSPICDVPCAEDNIKDWQNLIIDEGLHLGVQGSNIVADWIEDSFLKPQGFI
jgi:hypothetical protein